MKLRNIIFGLLTSAVIGSTTGIAHAQSYDPFPDSDECPIVISRICHGMMDDGTPILYAVPTGYDGQFVLTAHRVGQGYLIFMYDLIDAEIAAYMYVDENAVLMPSLNNRPAHGGNLRILADVTEEMADILSEIKAYY